VTDIIENLVVGGGAMGLSIAYGLMKQGRDARVLEGSYLNAGSTGRGLGVLKARNPYAMGNGNEDLVTLAREGLRLHGSLSSVMGINTFYKKSGCLIVAKNEQDLRELREHHEHFAKLGVKDIEMTPEEVHAKWPYIDSESVLAGFYSSDEANAHPFGLVWAYLENIKEMGGKVEKENPVKEIKKSSDGFLVKAQNGEYEAENVIVASAINSSDLTEPLGYKIPMTPMRKEVLISEAVRPFFGPTIERFSTHLQVTQTMRGEIMGTVDWMEPGHDLGETTSRFLNDLADELVPMIPVLRNLNVIRQWTGICDLTSDEKPAIGRLEDGLYVCCGFHDYGITMVPIVGKLLVESIIKKKTERLLEPFEPKRFE
jgi:sarcosine oxidase subunit beta